MLSTEITAVLDEDVLAVPRRCHLEWCIPRTETACMGGGAHTASDFWYCWILINEARS